MPWGTAVGKELDELTNQLQQAEDQKQALLRHRVSAGDATVTYMKDGQEHVGYVFAKVTLKPDNVGVNTGNWWAEVIGFTAPKNRAEEARAIALATYQSLQVESAWQEAQTQTTMNTAPIIATSSQQITHTLNRQYAKTQITRDNILRRY